MIGNLWNGFAPREKVLIGLAGGLTAAVILIFAIILPQMRATNEAQRSLAAALQDKALVEQAIITLSGSGPGRLGPAANGDAFRADVTRRAQALGLAITRLQNGAEGSLQFVFSEASPTDIYTWLEDVSALPGGQVLSANMTKREGRVQAVIELQGTQL